jgi:hypothetical protein
MIDAALYSRSRARYFASGDPIVDFTVDAGTSSVTLSAATVATGESLTLSIVARNAAGQGLSGKAITSVTLSPSGSGTVTGSGATAGGGMATRFIEGGDVAAGNTVTVVCDGVTLDDVPVFEVTGAPSSGTIWADIWEDIWADIWATT